jgi:3,4-dihydroxy-2-butanone 4-phosphate synthase
LDRDLDEPAPGFDGIRGALADLAAGKFLVVLDDENRENEGDLIIAADKVRGRGWRTH